MWCEWFFNEINGEWSFATPVCRISEYQNNERVAGNMAFMLETDGSTYVCWTITLNFLIIFVGKRL